MSNILTVLGSTSKFTVPLPVSSFRVATLCRAPPVVHIHIHVGVFLRAPSSREQHPRKHGAHLNRGDPINI